jgi:hypothetical protein
LEKGGDSKLVKEDIIPNTILGKGWKLINLVGQKFGRLTVIKRVSPNTSYGGNARWLCKCDCGKEKIIVGRNLRNGNTKSCGCLKKEIQKNRNKLNLGLANMRQKIINYKIGAERRKLEYNLTEEQFAEITQQNCYYCGAKPGNIANAKTSFGEYIYNGLDRIDNTKGYMIDNVVSCCKHCNIAKNTFTLKEFKDWIKRIYKKLIEQRENYE